MFHIAIVEDSRLDRSLLCEYIERYAKENGEICKISEYENAVNFLTGYKPVFDAVFLDIQMPYMDGMQAAKKLRELDPEVALVFITNMSNFAVHGYSVNAVDFVVKPVVYLNFAAMFAKVLRLAKKKTEEIVIKMGGGGHRIPIDSIIYVEAIGHEIIYHTENGELRLWSTLKEQLAKLPSDRFVYITRYCFINLKHLSSVEGSDIIVNGQTFTVTRSKKKEFEAKLLVWYGENF